MPQSLGIRKTRGPLTCSPDLSFFNLKTLLANVSEILLSPSGLISYCIFFKEERADRSFMETGHPHRGELCCPRPSGRGCPRGRRVRPGACWLLCAAGTLSSTRPGDCTVSGRKEASLTPAEGRHRVTEGSPGTQSVTVPAS